MAKPARERARSEEKSSAGCCDPSCCGESNCCGGPAPGGCKVEAVIRVDDRGQMVLPKEVREGAGIRAGEKLAVVSWARNGEVCCLGLLRADDLAESVRQTYGPLLRDIVRS
jgi:antitoxin PrlF